MRSRLAAWLGGGGRGALAGRTVVIGVHAGGLGDHLACSALPRLYKAAGARRVLLSSRTNFGEPFARNPEIGDFAWRDNPFLDGFTDEPPDVGERGWPPDAFFRAAKTSASPVDAVAQVHGLSVLARDGATRLIPPRPDLFHRRSPRTEFADVVVCDPRSTSQPFAPELFAAFGRHVERWHGLALDEVVVLDGRHAGVNGAATLPGNRRHVVRSLFDYADIVASAKAFLVTEPGGQSVAAAVRSGGAFVLISTRAFNERLFLWPCNRYVVSGGMTPGDQEWP